ncbi:glutathione peroxidase [Umboniibacter marinipuniceus]|uniref:Glutathione peroxidase n=1 Tax=Umboniibacter marinipuniceus TaxID=569599 RepID=A0A3M0A0R5_9GAMM|nr:glutathione peroxidase [Umboniibacter marinipuniceus]RMA78721.1 glutathione peroxidase [Umboniibacter marinipuniceus]
MSVYDFEVQTNKGESVTLDEYKGKVLLVVNTASKCGFTPQYKGLESLYSEFKSEGFEVLGFPCNQFGKQEPGDDQEIASFCDLNFGVSFPLFKKIDVNGDAQSPLFSYLKTKAPGIAGTTGVKWNFTKFLVGRDGQVLRRYAPKTKPEAIAADIKVELAKQA